MKWKTMSTAEKIATVVACIGVVFYLLDAAKPGLLPFPTTYPAIVLVTVCEAIAYWNKKRKWSYLLIAGAVISLGCFILELVLL